MSTPKPSAPREFSPEASYAIARMTADERERYWAEIGARWQFEQDRAKFAALIEACKELHSLEMAAEDSPLGRVREALAEWSKE